MRYPVASEKDFKAVPKDAQAIHLVRPLKKERIEKLFLGRRIKTVYLSKSTKKRLGKRARKFFTEKGVKIIEEKRAGRAISVDLKKRQKIVELHKDYQSYRKIEELLGIPKSTAHYLIKYAQRAKVKTGKNIVYL